MGFYGRESPGWPTGTAAPGKYGSLPAFVRPPSPPVIKTEERSFTLLGAAPPLSGPGCLARMPPTPLSNVVFLSCFLTAFIRQQ